jgi:hypothetical protein
MLRWANKIVEVNPVWLNWAKFMTERYELFALEIQGWLTPWYEELELAYKCWL